jgi:hypothetical protein
MIKSELKGNWKHGSNIYQHDEHSIPYWPLKAFEKVFENHRFSPNHLKLIKLFLEDEDFIKDRKAKLAIIESKIVEAVIEKMKGNHFINPTERR